MDKPCSEQSNLGTQGARVITTGLFLEQFFSKNINYDSNIVADNYEDLEKKITFLFDDFGGALLKQKKTKDYLFQDFNKYNYIN